MGERIAQVYRFNWFRLVANYNWLAAGPSAYVFFSRTVMNLREKEDYWAAGFGGFMMGGVLGMPSM